MPRRQQHHGFRPVCRRMPHSITVALLYLLLSGLTATSAAATPNLFPYPAPGPPGRTDSLVVAHTLAAESDSGTFTAGTPLYVNWAVANGGDLPVTAEFLVTLLIDNEAKFFWRVAELAANFLMQQVNFEIGSLCSGTHIIAIDVDSTATVAESNEADNRYEKTITVVPGSVGAQLQACPLALDFGEVETGDIKKKLINCTNIGLEPLVYSAIAISNDDAAAFSLSMDGCSGRSLPAMACSDTYTAACRVSVTFAPQVRGEHQALLRIPSSDPSNSPLSVPLSGTGIRAAGDLDNSGQADLADAILAARVAVDLPPPVAIDLAGEINGNNRIGLEEALYSMQRQARRQRADIHEVVRIRTDFGYILIWLYDQTPIHRDNFLKLIRAGFYDGLIFHRVIDGFMIQGGDPDGDGSGGPGYTLPAEIDCSLIHSQGALAAARLGDTSNPDKRSSGSQFYIVENANGTPQLDMNYTVFGQVIDGISVVEAIAAVPKVAGTDRPVDDVKILGMDILSMSTSDLLNDYNFMVP